MYCPCPFPQCSLLNVFGSSEPYLGSEARDPSLGGEAGRVARLSFVALCSFRSGLSEHGAVVHLDA